MFRLTNTKVLTFDLFGTILDLETSLTPALARFLQNHGSDADPSAAWQRFRSRQRIEQYQDSLLLVGHSGYLATAGKAFDYTARTMGFSPTREETGAFLNAWQDLIPFQECHEALMRLSDRFALVVLSNGDERLLDHLVANQLQFAFTDVISVDLVGAFKPHPAVYRAAARRLRVELGELLMVSANSFDVLGARTCGLRAAYVNRYDLPFEEADEQFQPDLTVTQFSELADALLG